MPGLITYIILENQSTLHGYPLQYFTTFYHGSNSIYLPYFLIDVVFWFLIVYAGILTLREVRLEAMEENNRTDELNVKWRHFPTKKGDEKTGIG